MKWLRRTANTLNSFTVGKLYPAYLTTGEHYVVIDDSGKEKVYYKDLILDLFDEVGEEEDECTSQ